MALVNYTDLQAAIADWMARADLTARIPDFITLAEAKFNRTLRTHQMLTASAGLTLTAGVATLPATFVEWVGAEWINVGATRRVSLTYREPDSAFWRQKYRPGGDPSMFTIYASTIVIRAIVAGTLDFHFYAAIPALSTGSPTNWLLTLAPDLYLSTANAYAAQYINNEEKAAAAYALADQELAKAVNQSDASKVSRRPTRDAITADMKNADDEIGL